MPSGGSETVSARLFFHKNLLETPANTHNNVYMHISIIRPGALNTPHVLLGEGELCGRLASDFLPLRRMMSHFSADLIENKLWVASPGYCGCRRP